MTSGGRREGAGRPTLDKKKKRVLVTLSVAPETQAMLNQLRERNIKVGQVVDDLVRQYFEMNF